MRLFIAIEIPENIKEFLLKIIPINLPLDGVNVVQKQNLHITLKFLGEVEESLIPDIKETLKSISGEFSAFTLKITRPGVFPDKFKPRVIWIGTENTDTLKTIAKRIDENLHKYGFEKEQREFKAHITLARVKNFQNGRYLFERILKAFKDKITSEISVKKKFSSYDIVETIENSSPIKFSVTEFVLMKSTLTPKGSIYNVLERFPLVYKINGIIKQNA